MERLLKKILVIFLGIALLVPIMSVNSSALEKENSVDITYLNINGYNIDFPEGKDRLGVVLSYDAKSAYLLIPASEGVTIEGLSNKNGTNYFVLEFTEKESQVYKFALKSEKESKVYYLVLFRGEAPTTLEIIKEKAYKIFQSLQLTLVIVPVTLIIMHFAMPTEKKEKK